MIFKLFLKKARGSVSVEFAFVSIAMVAVIFFSMDTGMYIMEKNKLERISYSLVTIIRERSKFFDSRQEVTQKDANDLALIAAKLMNASLAENIKVKVEALYFVDAESAQSPPIIGKRLSFVSQKPSTLDDQQCFSHLPAMDKLKDKSVWVESKHWLPIFRVSICAPNRNKSPMPYFEYGNETPSLFVTSSIAIIR